MLPHWKQFKSWNQLENYFGQGLGGAQIKEKVKTEFMVCNDSFN